MNKIIRLHLSKKALAFQCQNTLTDLVADKNISATI
jgi:hypothetical protein